jgi:hypothetical protein
LHTFVFNFPFTFVLYVKNFERLHNAALLKAQQVGQSDFSWLQQNSSVL